MMPHDAVLLPIVHGMVSTWKAEAMQRRRRIDGDPAASVLESCASELESEIARALDERRDLTVPQYAASHNVNPSTVRRWIERGELSAVKDEAGEWQIPITARRTRQRVARPSLRVARG